MCGQTEMISVSKFLEAGHLFFRQSSKNYLKLFLKNRDLKLYGHVISRLKLGKFIITVELKGKKRKPREDCHDLLTKWHIKKKTSDLTVNTKTHNMDKHKCQQLLAFLMNQLVRCRNKLN